MLLVWSFVFCGLLSPLKLMPPQMNVKTQKFTLKAEDKFTYLYLSGLHYINIWDQKMQN